MQNRTMGSQLEASLQHDMDLIRKQVGTMAALCERAIVEATRALFTGEQQAAYLVILRDQQIDESEQQLDRLCLEFLVRQQPAAGHLRFAYAALKISGELERIGDHAEAIARRVLKIEKRPDIAYGGFEAMGTTCLGMLRDAIRAFTGHDATLARQTMLVEETIDRMRRSLDEELRRLQRAGQLDVDAFALLVTITRRLERISDEVRDVCAEVLYMCTGDFVKHAAPEAYRVLFVDQHNHCRSRMAEAIATALAVPHMLFTSAGLEPRAIDPRLPLFLAAKGLEISHPQSRSLDQVPNLAHHHLVIAFDESAYYSLRFHRTPTVCIAWSVPDPSVVDGTPEEVRAAYEATFTFIRTHLEDLIEAIGRRDGQAAEQSGA
jgi:phosphate transport system protein